MTASPISDRAAAMLGFLERCAELGKVCPSLEALAKRFETSSTTIIKLLDELRRGGRISWRIVYCGTGVGNVRTVTITASRRQTATPRMVGRGPRPTASAADSDLERAKTVLRRRGKIVFDATVTDGRAGKGFVKVDGHDLTPDQVIALAEPYMARAAA